MKNKKNIIIIATLIGLIMAGVIAVILLLEENEQNVTKSQEEKSSQDSEEFGNVITHSFNPELYSILFEKEPYKYRVSYTADNYLATIEGEQDLIYFESFLVYEEDNEGNILNCKTVMITKPELNQKYMEDYLKDVYGQSYEYIKPFDNVYVHFEVIMQ